MSVSSRVQLQKLLKTQTSLNRQQLPSNKPLRSDSLYNLKDFLPNTSSAKTQTRPKTNSTYLPLNTNQYQNIKKTNNPIPNNIEQKMIEQKMNKLKQQNFQLQQSLNQQKTINQQQTEQINQLQQIINNIKNTQQKKHNQLSIWSYKYHVQYIPKQKHKYSLAVQTEDIFTSKTQASGTLKAKDFQDIYRRLNLNSNPSTIQGGNKRIIKQPNSLKSTLNFTSQNVSSVQPNISSVKMSKINEGKKSIFKMPKLEDFIQKENKQNMMGYSNLNFSRNPMQINLTKIRSDQKPIKEQCLQIYAVEEEYLNSIVGELLCGDDQ